MNDDIINLESRLVFRDVSKLTAGGMSTAAALAHAAHEAAERKAKMTTGFAQDDYIRSLEEQIATLQSELAERWENLNVQDGVIDGLREEIAALRAEKLTDASALRLALERIAELEKVVEALLSRSKVFGASGLTHEEAKALREAGYLKEEG